MQDDPKNGTNGEQEPEEAGIASERQTNGLVPGAAAPPAALDSGAAEKAFFAGEAGASASDDEVDPELLKIPRRRRSRRHPLVSIIVIGLSVAMIVWLWDQFAYFTRPRAPLALGEAASAVRSGRLSHNTYVTLEGVPDRKNALIIEGRAGGYDSFFKLHQTGNRLFVQMHRETRSSDEEIGMTHSGRLVFFDALPHARRLKEYLSKRMTIAHDLPFSGVKKALSGGGREPTVADVKGGAVKLNPDSMIWINVAFPNEWVVQYSKHVFASSEQAEKELESRLEGLGIPSIREDETSRLFWKFAVVAEPDQFPQLRARLKQELVGGRPAVEVVRRQLSYSARWNQLKLSGDALVIDAADPTFPTRYARAPDDAAKLVPVQGRPVKVPGSSILFISTSAPFSVPADAMVLVQGHTPGDNWHYLLLFILLSIFVGINLAVLGIRVAQHVKGSQQS